MSDETIEETTEEATDEVAEETPVEPDPNAVPITLNGREVIARKGETLIAAAERHGEYIPRFCYHSRMEPVGMCRQCMVDVDTGRGPQLQPSCMVTVSPEMKVETESPRAKRAQEGVLELLLANHPLDCPVCDKGGECPLQDQAFSHGPAESRYVEQKRHYEKPISISDHILLDRERCILCDRCTRFADEVVGDKLIHFIDRGNLTQVNTFPEEPFASYFSGNIAQICPVGALTAKPYRFKARPWDLEQVESTCMTCASGCRVSIHSSRDELLRVQGVDVESVNWGWMCDKGRFNFQHVGSDDRLSEPLVLTDDGHAPTNWASAMALAEQLVRDALASGGPDSIGVLGGARLTNESNFAWAQLADAVGIERRDPQLGDGLPADVLGLERATIADMANASTVILLGPDLKEELGILYIRLRDAVTRGSTKVIEFASSDTGFTGDTWKSVRYQPGAINTVARDLFATDEVRDQLATGDVVVVAGRGNLAVSEHTTMAELHSVLQHVPDAKVLPAYRRGNVVGALQLGMGPASPDRDGLSTLRAAAENQLDLLILLGADPISDCPDGDLARRAIAGARRVISLDTFMTDSTARADLVLPVADWAEQSGTTTNIEGRVSQVNQKVTVHATARPDWMVAAQLALQLGHDVGFTSVEEATDAIQRTVAAYAPVTAAALADSEGVLTNPTVSPPAPVDHDDIHASGYDYRLIVNRKLYDNATMTAHSPSLAGLAPGAAARIHPSDLDRVGEAAGTEVSIVAPTGTIVLPLTPDTAVQRGTLVVAFNQPGGARIADVIDSTAPVLDVRIERLGAAS